jgi:membrane protein implicated in regulation of membrane protease activity
MPGKQEEGVLLFVSLGVVLFSILAVVLFILNIMTAFYVAAVLAIVLGFYLSRNLSNMERNQQQKPAPRRAR